MPSATLKTKLGLRYLDIGGGAAGDRTGAFVPLADNEGLRASYGVYSSNIVPPANPTDFFTIRGSATKLIRVKQFYISGTAAAATNIIIQLVRRSTQNTGGTFVPLTPIRHDQSDDAVTAAVGYYSANPTGLGTAIGTVHGGRLNLAPAANGAIDRLMFDYGWRNDKALVLDGVNDVLSLNFNGVAWPAGGAIDIDMMFLEEQKEPVL